MSFYRKVIYATLGLICFLIGAAGIFLPVIPHFIPFSLSFLFFKRARISAVSWLMKSGLMVRFRLLMRRITRRLDSRWPKLRSRKRTADFLKWLRRVV